MAAMTAVMMECGHAANSRKPNGAPACVICVGVHSGAERIAAVQPALEGRVARCSYFGSVPRGRSHEGPCGRGNACRCERPSHPSLAFFGYKPEQAHDEFYCGCWGWD